MDRERIRALLQQLHTHQLRLEQLTADLPVGASVPSDDVMTAMIEISELQNELEFLQNDSDSADPESLVAAPVRPRPSLSSGAKAIPE